MSSTFIRESSSLSIIDVPDEPSTVLKHCPTRWLSLLKCVNRYLSQYQGLQSYFLSCEEAETVKVRSIVSRLENPLTKPLLHFLAFILPSFDRFNRLFQKSTENTTSQLYDKMNRLVRLYVTGPRKTTFMAGGIKFC